MRYKGLLAIGGMLLMPAICFGAGQNQAERLAKGKAISYDLNKGNCLACHMMADGELPGNFGPPLIQMKQRYPKRAKLRTQIWDATVANPVSIMPPFGKHGILSEEEVDMVVDYLYTL